MKIYPVILAGGSGTRLWPVSRKSYPKQFSNLVGDQTLFQQSVLRTSGENYAEPIIVANSDFRFIIGDQLKDIAVKPGTILIEPDSRNTGPAVLAATLIALQSDPEAIVLVTPSDHVIPDKAAFETAVRNGIEATSSGQMVTFGVTPNRPETGYGYLELSQPTGGEVNAIELLRFVEKPDINTAAQMIATGTYLWNSGIFLARAADMVAAYEKHAQNMIQPVRDAVSNAREDLGFLRLDPAAWSQAPDLSIDYAVMEHATNLSVVLLNTVWSDLGGWDAVWREGPQDEHGVQASGSVTAIDCRNSLLRADAEDLELVGIGLENVFAVAMNDAVIVADMSKAQDVKAAVETLKNREAPQATSFPKDHRPWGWFEGLVLGKRFQVKRIHVHPGAALSLQSHQYRAEHWIVVEGTAKVTIDGDVELISENHAVYISLGAIHRLENPGKAPLVLIEVQTGSYLGEDDIIRYEDVYARS